MGGIPLLTPAGSLAEECHLAACSSVDFELENAYYAWPKTTTFSSGRYSQTPEEDPWREYLTSFISRRSAEWIGAHVDSPRPWLCFVTHSAAHTPIQPPPQAMIDVDNFAPECEVPIAPFGSGGFRAQFRLMVEAVDRSIGDMLVELDLATRDGETVTLRDPAVTNTTIIVLNDNGSLGSTVKSTVQRAGRETDRLPDRASGIRSSLVGPMVAEPGSVVDEIVNCVDLFGLMWRHRGGSIGAPRYRRRARSTAIR